MVSDGWDVAVMVMGSNVDVMGGARVCLYALVTTCSPRDFYFTPTSTTSRGDWDVCM